jgi:hypothetical protein
MRIEVILLVLAMQPAYVGLKRELYFRGARKISNAISEESSIEEIYHATYRIHQLKEKIQVLTDKVCEDFFKKLLQSGIKSIGTIKELDAMQKSMQERDTKLNTLLFSQEEKKLLSFLLSILRKEYLESKKIKLTELGKSYSIEQFQSRLKNTRTLRIPLMQRMRVLVDQAPNQLIHCKVDCILPQVHGIEISPLSLRCGILGKLDRRWQAAQDSLQQLSEKSNIEAIWNTRQFVKEQARKAKTVLARLNKQAQCKDNKLFQTMLENSTELNDRVFIQCKKQLFKLLLQALPTSERSSSILKALKKYPDFSMPVFQSRWPLMFEDMKVSEEWKAVPTTEEILPYAVQSDMRTIWKKTEAYAAKQEWKNSSTERPSSEFPPYSECPVKKSSGQVVDHPIESSNLSEDPGNARLSSTRRSCVRFAKTECAEQGSTPRFFSPSLERSRHAEMGSFYSRTNQSRHSL